MKQLKKDIKNYGKISMMAGGSALGITAMGGSAAGLTAATSMLPQMGMISGTGALLRQTKRMFK